jgi:hypothetical protein
MSATYRAARRRLTTVGALDPAELAPLPNAMRTVERMARRGECRRVRMLPLFALPPLADQIERARVAESADLQPSFVRETNPAGRTMLEARRRLAARGYVTGQELRPLPQIGRALGRMANRGECLQIGTWPIWALPTVAARIQAALVEYQNGHSAEAKAA